METKKYKVAILGLGGRGRNYGNCLAQNPDIGITSVCDKYQVKIDNVAKAWGVPTEACFTDEKDFFAQGKIADLMIIATQDRDHYGHACKALELGYDIMMEKPVSPIIEECLDLERRAEKVGRKILVCHVLRYSHYYKRIKEIIDEGTIGRVLHIAHEENVAYWHFAHSYARGLWRREEETSPMLLAKCCHDVDLMYWYAGAKCKSLSSVGGLDFFNSANKPDGAADNCFDCKLAEDCIFEARYQYVGRKKGIYRTAPKFKWGAYAFCSENGKAGILKSLKGDAKGKLWARCVFACDNDVADNQDVLMEMENGVRITLSVNAYNEHDYRHTVIKGTKGELIADDRGSVLELRVFDRPKKKIVVNFIPIIKGHYGGDQGLLKAAVGMLKGEEGQLTTLNETLESHRIIAAAELSRKEGGRKVDMFEIPSL